MTAHTKTAKLFTEVCIAWTDHRDREHESLVEVEYTFDGDELRIISQRGNGPDDDYLFDELVFDAVMDEAPEAYSEWLADYGDYLHEQRIDREAA